jgi:hypothetical protein
MVGDPRRINHWNSDSPLLLGLWERRFTAIRQTRLNQKNIRRNKLEDLIAAKLHFLKSACD